MKIKSMYIVRGLPGGGKSYLANEIREVAELDNMSCVVLSTDDFWMVDGEYKFNGRRLSEAHQWNQARFRKHVGDGTEIIVVDNTNTQFWEMAPYMEFAIANDYIITIREPTTSWAKDIDECVKRNTHNVPRQAIEKMMNRWDTTEDVLEGAAEKYGVTIDLLEKNHGIIYHGKSND